MTYDIISLGGLTKDISFFSEEGQIFDNSQDILRQELLAFELGAKIRVAKFKKLYGGGAANSAVNFATSNFKTAVLASLGKDEAADSILKNLEDNGVSTELISLDTSLDSGLSFIVIVPSGERVIFTSRGANDNLALSAKAKRAIKGAKYLYISSLSGNWRETLKEVFAIAGPKIAWNPGTLQYRAGLKFLKKYLKKTEILFLNQDEATELVLSLDEYKRKSRRFLDKVENLLEIIHSYGPKKLVITQGENGASAFDGKHFYYQAIFKERKRLDMTGVGDAFNSSVIISLNLYPENLAAALYLGAKNTAQKIAHYGAHKGLVNLRKLNLPKELRTNLEEV